MEKLRYYVKYTYGYYWSSLSYLSIFLSIVLILGLPQEVVQLNIFYKILITIGIFVLTFLITLLWYVLFKKKVIVNLQQDKTITVKCGDIFTQNGNIVMPVNLYFDTLVKDGLVAEKSIHGQFVKKNIWR
ncbi:hypothetical protein SSCH_650001 [Syntrophaceticus schinkii]|uniref:Thoeris protein ThsA Macro domain-containing protein n=2 Tax=Syntrophaceticus schinkii TaxID=499207 RepID=A0A0B7MH08_9FIRM|nr:hypothetical protein SSCH_650001 [Syntrophaceticus schinkii]